MDKKIKFQVKAMGNTNTEALIRMTAKRIVEAGVDVTGDYKQWLNICFGFTLELGEGGRDLFHQISQFSPKYKRKDCEKLYDDCMKRLQTGGKEGITIGSFFKYAKDAGIAPVTPVGQTGQTAAKTVGNTPAAHPKTAEDTPVEAQEPDLPTFTDKVEKKLPSIVEDVAAQGSTYLQKDMLVITALVLLSGSFPKVWASYDNRRVFSNLFFFLVAPPASNKGIISSCLQLVMPIEKEIRDYNQREMEAYKQQLAELKASKNKVGAPMPPEPPYRSLLISANTSSTACYQALSDNNGEGITFETEADSLSLSLKSDYGNYSDGLRKGFHHELISYTRRTDKEHVCVNHPKWSVMLTGTPGQVTTLIPSSEDGLFSRFLFLLGKREGTWRNVFLKKECTIDEAMAAIGERIYAIHRLLENADEKGIEFELTESQQDKFNDYFDKLYKEYGSMMGNNFDASILRLGLSTFRIAMVLSITRLEGVTTLPSNIVCKDEDFDTAITIAETLIQHAAHIFANLMPSQEAELTDNIRLTDLQRTLFEALPDSFTRKQALALAPRLHMEPKTINKYIGYFANRFHICRRVKQGVYEKVKIAKK